MNRDTAAPAVRAWTALALLIILAWDATGLDLPMARLAGSATGFGLRDQWFLVQVMHEGARSASWLVLLSLLAGIRWPWGFLRQLALRERLQLATTVLVSVLAVALLKSASHTSCPWDLQVFGGVARQVSHWSWGLSDGGPGGCFPAGHACAALGYAGGWFALRRSDPRLAHRWLGVALTLGLLLGLGQQLRGAHHMSHTLWSAWICWSLGGVMDRLWHQKEQLLPARAPT
jgi:membrane-associated PAP2 superfamily phosphatase